MQEDGGGQKRDDEAEIQGAKEVLQALYQRSKSETKDARWAGMRTPVFAGLSADRPDSPAPALILQLITNLNEILDAVRRGRMFRGFSEDERRTLAGFTYKVGSCGVAAARYHGADETETLRSLCAFAAAYEPNEDDRMLDDVVGGFTAEDYWSGRQLWREGRERYGGGKRGGELGRAGGGAGKKNLEAGRIV